MGETARATKERASRSGPQMKLEASRTGTGEPANTCEPRYHHRAVGQDERRGSTVEHITRGEDRRNVGQVKHRRPPIGRDQNPRAVETAAEYSGSEASFGERRGAARTGADWSVRRLATRPQDEKESKGSTTDGAANAILRNERAATFAFRIPVSPTARETSCSLARPDGHARRDE